MDLVVDQTVTFKIAGCRGTFTGTFIEAHKMTGELLLAVDGGHRRYIQPAAVVR